MSDILEFSFIDLALEALELQADEGRVGEGVVHHVGQALLNRRLVAGQAVVTSILPK